ncbi:MAG TPA: squalene--hopene cyclase [Pirellulales bacterium]|nr:squalene--hopene cyclase [Pirellulales bacterium]
MTGKMALLRSTAPTGLCGRLLPLVLLLVGLGPTKASAQDPTVRFGETVPRDVREIYDRGLEYLANTQLENGEWGPQGQINRAAGSSSGVTALALMVMLASGEDPNFGVYSNNVRRGLRSLIASQNATTGIIGSSMYEHGFSMLTLAEAYGAVDDRNLWPAGTASTRSIGQALELAVRGAITSQKKNQVGGWRYSPDSTDADTSVSGAVLVGLLAARNAGIEVPDAAIDRAISYYTKMTSPSGSVAYSGGVGGMGQSTARTSIAALVYSIARRKDLPEFKSTLGYLVQQLEGDEASPFAEYARYYEAQALFQGDIEAWQKWNKQLVRQLKATQAADGSFPSQLGVPIGTSLTLLALAVNYRFLPIYER